MNFGALFGIGSGMTWVFVLASVAAVAFVAYMFTTSRRRQWVVHLALGLVLAGALGNLYDRIFVRVDVVMRGNQIRGYGVVTTPQPEEDGIRLGRYPDARPPIQYFPSAALRPGQPGQPVPLHLEHRTAVRDFIRVDTSFKLPWIGRLPVWPWIFNVADSMLVVGVGLLLIIYWRHPVMREAGATASEQASDPAASNGDGEIT